MKKLNVLFLLFASILVYAESTSFSIEKEVVMKNGSVYLVTDGHGLLFTSDKGKTWVSLNKGLPRKEVYPFNTIELRPLTSVYVDPLHPLRMAVTVSSAVFLSENGGRKWTSVPLGGVVKKTNFITSVTLSSDDPRKIILGTSFNGIFESMDKGESWRRVPLDLSPLYRGARFYEEITALALNGDDSSLAIACSLDNTLFISTGGKTPVPVKLPDGRTESIRSLEWEEGDLILFTDKSSYRYDGTQWIPSPLPFISRQRQRSTAKKERIHRAENKRGIYVNSFHASGDALEKLLSVIKSHGYNSMVVDMKDDEGRVTYNTALPLPHETGAVRVRFNLDKLVETAHKEGIYLIGRIVTFQDPVLYRFRNNTFALWDKKRNKPWGNFLKRKDEKTGEERLVQTEFWVDPFSSFVQDYNRAIAEELQKRGVDEIQFDYIRFPSDGKTNCITYRFRKQGMSRIDALESFVRRIREVITIPVSTDLYGFNSWYRMGNWIGQDIGMLSRYVDVISPMFYPSHFPERFKPESDYLAWAEMLYHIGTRRARAITRDRVVIRPYVQAFLMGKELSMNKKEYTAYLQRELKGAREGGASGFTLWNNSNRYYMLQ